MIFIQNKITLPEFSRGFHLITHYVISQISDLTRINMGVLHLFLLHTSASLTINENADTDVRKDFETYINLSVPENKIPYRHISEGSDDMPAHLKASLLGTSLTIPIRNGQLVLGHWQGIYLGEHRNEGGLRSIMATGLGESQQSSTHT